jgi:hypothetical protein
LCGGRLELTRKCFCAVVAAVKYVCASIAGSRMLSATHQAERPWPNGQGVGLLIRRLRVRVPQGVTDYAAHTHGCGHSAALRPSSHRMGDGVSASFIATWRHLSATPQAGATGAPPRRMAQHHFYGFANISKKLFTLLDLCVSSLRRGHANLLCIVPILTDDPRRESESVAYPEVRHRTVLRRAPR